MSKPSEPSQCSVCGSKDLYFSIGGEWICNVCQLEEYIKKHKTMEIEQ